MVSLKAARRAAVPLVMIETADPGATIQTLLAEVNGKGTEVPVARWDFGHGIVLLTEAAATLFRGLDADALRSQSQNPVEALLMAEKVDEQEGARFLLFFQNVHRYWDNEQVVQCIWNLRDRFKGMGATFVGLMPPATKLPVELKEDCVVLVDTLPTEVELEQIASRVLDNAEEGGMNRKAVTDATLEKINDAMLGLSAFAAEQVLFMSVSKAGVDTNALWERKCKMIEQTPGLSVWRGGETFEDIGGYDNVKGFMRRIAEDMRSIVFIDEIEKAMSGNKTDTSGVSQDQLRSLLMFMQDEEALGVIFIGPPGSGKSAVAKAAGNTAGIPTISFDLGAMKGSLVGESERQLRAALNVVKAVAQGKMLFIATCNSIAILPPELRRRFSLGTFFFPLPSKGDRVRIWDIYTKKYKIKAQELPNDNGWTGAEIRNCAMLSYRLKSTLKEAAGFVVPVSVAAADEIDKLCREAHRKYISASFPGLYEYEKMPGPGISPTARRLEVE